MPNKSQIEYAGRVLDLLKEEFPEVKPALDFTNPFELLIATILSAQCTDERVNIVTKTLFRKYKSPQDYLNVPAEELERDIYSTGFYKQKAKSIQNCCKVLAEKYGGKVPVDFDTLVTLPGVGRKTASVVAGNAFNVPAIAVDTHVKRLANLLGLASSDDPEKIEASLKELYPSEEWVDMTHRIIYHGRKTCIARRPKCGECVLNEICPSSSVRGKV